jgi:hypothetical protein
LAPHKNPPKELSVKDQYDAVKNEARDVENEPFFHPLLSIVKLNS